MDTEFNLSLKNAADLEEKLREAGWDNAYMGKIAVEDLANLLQVVKGYGEFVQLRHIIEPKKPKELMPEYKLLTHKESPPREITPESIGLYSSPLHKSTESESNQLYWIEGIDVKRDLEVNNIDLCNGNVLDYYLEHQGIIPEYWKAEVMGEKQEMKYPVICFWATSYVFSDSDDEDSESDEFFIRALSWNPETSKYEVEMILISECWFPHYLVAYWK